MIPSGPDAEAMRAALLGWYRANGRPLAFRRTTDPWAILVSEVMAQQTQAARAAVAWEQFLLEFPTPAALAAASPADALRAWRGLGYNRRALSLRAAAVQIVARHGGRLPADVEALDALPGVGPYTARAVAGLAFGVRAGAVDTNVRRVLSRVAARGPATDAHPPEGDVQAIADRLVPGDAPGEWTHALMDVGATFCRPRNPRCDGCPLRAWCRFAGRRMAGKAQTVSRDRTEPPFESSSRWLRGRILDRLRDVPDGAWARLDPPIGSHDAGQVDVALASLVRDGLAERHPTDPSAARLPAA